MSFDGDFIGKFHQLARENLYQFRAGLARLGVAFLEEQAALGFQQIDAQTFRGDGHADLVLHVLKRGNLLHHLLQLLFQALQILAIHGERFADARVGGAGLTALSGGILKIAAHRFLHFFARAQQPQNDKQRHHRSDEIGIGDFPGAAVLIIVLCALAS